MKIFFRRFIAILSSIIFALAGVSESVIGFTAGNPIQATRHEYCFDNSGLLIGGYYSTKDELMYCKDSGIDFIVASNVDKSYLDLAQEYGIGIIATDYNLPYCYEEMTDEATQAYVNADINAYRNHPALWGDNVIDEPFAHCYPNIAKSVNAYSAQHPEKLPFVNLFPMYAGEDQLDEHLTLKKSDALLTPFSDHFLDSVHRFKAYTSDYINQIDTDYICVDIYPYHSRQKNGVEEKYTEQSWIRNLDVLAEACHKTGRDLWVITQAAGLTKDGSVDNVRYCDEVSDISQQAFACISFGSKAIIHAEYGHLGWWDADSHMIGSDGKPTETYYAVSKVNSYLADFAKVYGDYSYTSTYLINRHAVAGYRHGRLACEVISEEGNIRSNGGLLVGTFTGENGSKAYAITNMEELNKNKTVEFQFDVPKGKTATIYCEGKVIIKEASFKMNLIAGAGAFITVN